MERKRITCIQDVIEVFGGPDQTAEVVSTHLPAGKPINAASVYMWRQREDIPERVHGALKEALEARGYIITVRELDALPLEQVNA